MHVSFDSAAEELDLLDEMPILCTLLSAPLRTLIALIQITSSAFFTVVIKAFSFSEKPWKHELQFQESEFRKGVFNLVRATLAFMGLFAIRKFDYRPPITIPSPLHKNFV